MVISEETDTTYKSITEPNCVSASSSDLLNVACMANPQVRRGQETDASLMPVVRNVF